MLRLLVCVALTIVPAALGKGAIWSKRGGMRRSGETNCVAGNGVCPTTDDCSPCIPGTSNTSLSTASTTLGGWKANYWFSFGDSYTQTGFTPNGTLPAVGNPLGNPPYPGSTATGGENWIDFITTTHNTSLVFTYNYAYGGATIDATLVHPSNPTVLSLTDQVNEFLSGAGTKPGGTPWTTSDALFSVWIGINDIRNTYHLSGDRDAFSDTLLNAYFALVQKLAQFPHICISFSYTPLFLLFSDVGARHFLFLNVPPVDRSPFMLAQPASSQAAAKTIISGFNSKLDAKITAFKHSNCGVSTYLWDAHTAFTEILDDPIKYGFKDATTDGTGDGIFWGNDFHPASAGHKIFGQEIGRLLAHTIW